jgi:hypothetical protein
VKWPSSKMPTKERMKMQKRSSPSLQFIQEPSLEFRFAQKTVDPKAGLSIFGPYDTDFPSHPKNISWGVVGTRAGISLASNFFRLVQSPIISETASKNFRLWPAFPGFQASFYASLADQPTRSFELDSSKLIMASSKLDPNRRAYEVVNLFLEGINHLVQSEDPIHVIICSVPDIVSENCRPKSRVREGIGEKVPFFERRRRAGGQTDLFGTYEVEMYRYSVDFRRQLKARAMQFGIPTQIILESTFKTDETPSQFESRGTSPLSDRAWNICTTLYYKAGGKPWRLSTARDGVCYVGIVYHKTDAIIGNKTACCAAQLFLDTGDGVVIRGEFGPWFSPNTGQFHVNRRAAQALLTKVLDTYALLEGKPLREVFLHYRASINEEEYDGFKSACPSNVKLVCIRVRREEDESRLYREGMRPIIRGTFLQINSRRGYLWSAGFKPFYGTYDGWETPVPLRIDIEYGEESITQVATDILGLTKLNFNECKYGDANPVTIGFSDAVGEVLVSNPTITNPSPRFKFYI